MPAFSYEIDYGPMLFAPPQMCEIKIGQLAAAEPKTEQNSESRAVSFAFQCVWIRSLPKAVSFVCREPIAKPDTQLLRTFHSPDTSGEFGAEQASIRSLVR